MIIEAILTEEEINGLEQLKLCGDIINYKYVNIQGNDGVEITFPSNWKMIISPSSDMCNNATIDLEFNI